MTSGYIFSFVCHLYGDDGDFNYTYIYTVIGVASGYAIKDLSPTLERAHWYDGKQRHPNIPVRDMSPLLELPELSYGTQPQGTPCTGVSRGGSLGHFT